MENKRRIYMNEPIEVGIGFFTGRPNVCNIINSYYKNMLEQIKKYHQPIHLTIFILYDMNYQVTKRTQFYNIIPQVYRNKIKIQYITPEMLEEEKKMLISEVGLTVEEADLFMGYGHARGRNTIMYYAMRQNIDYLLFWDDDEYPVANIKEDDHILWKKQDNILQHLKYIEDSDVTIGYHCGYISPIPYIDYKEDIEEEVLRRYIEAISNDIITWDSIKQKFEEDNGVTYAKKEIANQMGVYEIEEKNGGKWVAGSTLCLNLNHIQNIPAFYSPPGARGEDTFFSTNLKNAKVTKVPVYHFHDGFLRYTSIMKNNYPNTLRKIQVNEQNIETRFVKASIGWIKYKPLFLYITDQENYSQKTKEIEEKLKLSIPGMNQIFHDTCFDVILEEFKEYHKYVKKDYTNYNRTNQIWKNIKEEYGKEK